MTFDPNLRDESWSHCFVQSRHTLETWLDFWVGGANLRGEMYPQSDVTSEKAF